ncbi:MAG: S-layer homology domain-containing protein [Eubacteriales bacterium]
MKKIVSSLSVALLLSLSSISTTHATQLEGASSWATGFLETAISNNIVPEELQCNYTQATTRAEFCQLAVATYEEVTGQEITERKTFSDTSDVNVEKMAGLGVVAGTGGTSFTPNRSLNREEAALILSNLLESLSINLTETTVSFDDSADISNWASVAVGKVSEAKVMSGVGNNLFAPKDSYDREQSMVTMLRVFESVTSSEVDEVTSISISPDNYYLADGETLTLSVITNLGTDNLNVDWSSTDIKNFPVSNGSVTSVGQGVSAKITATTENGLSDFCFIMAKSDDIVTTVTESGNVYGKFPEIPAFENISNNTPLRSEWDNTYTLEDGTIFHQSYFYSYQTYYQEEALDYAQKYVDYLKKCGFTLTREEGSGYTSTDTLAYYVLSSPSEKYSISIRPMFKNTELHLSGDITVIVDYLNGTINNNYFNPSFDESLVESTPVIPHVTPPSTTSPNIPEAEINAIEIELIKNSIEGVRCLSATIEHLGDAIDRGTQGTALLDCTEAIMDFLQSGTYAMNMIEKVAPLLEVDDKYAEMNKLLLQYSVLVAEICEDFLSKDPETDFNILAPIDSNFVSMLRNLTTDIDDAAVYLKQATDMLYD